MVGLYKDGIIKKRPHYPAYPDRIFVYFSFFKVTYPKRQLVTSNYLENCSDPDATAFLSFLLTCSIASRLQG